MNESKWGLPLVKMVVEEEEEEEETTKKKNKTKKCVSFTFVNNCKQTK